LASWPDLPKHIKAAVLGPGRQRPLMPFPDFRRARQAPPAGQPDPGARGGVEGLLGDPGAAAGRPSHGRSAALSRPGGR
jgi:hypothetical protein